MGYTAKIPTCIIGMEACCGSHFIGAALATQGEVAPQIRTGG
jgi:hypothetical protein